MADNVQQGVYEIDILAVLKTIWKNILLIILVAAIGGSAAFGYTLFMVEPKYSATTTLYVNKSTFSLGDANLGLSTNLSTSSIVNIYMLIVQSRTTLEEVIDEADLDMTYKNLGKMIDVSSMAEGAFSITVETPDPAQSELIANTIAKILPDRIASIIDGTSARVIDYAIIPSTRSSPNYIKSTIIGILAGALLCSIIVVIVSTFKTNYNSPIDSAEELKALYPDIPVLVSIPDMRSKNKKGYYSSYYEADNSKGGKK